MPEELPAALPNPMRAVFCLIRENTGVLALPRDSAGAHISGTLSAPCLHERATGASSLAELLAAKLEKVMRYQAPANGPMKAHVSGTYSTPRELGEEH